MKKISVIIPIYNLEKEIERCLDSVAIQDFDKRDYEICAVLDSCTDNTEGIVREWKKEHVEICLNIFNAQCRTPGLARNVGLDMSEGEYVWFIDGDDYLTDMQAFSKLIGAMHESKRPVGYLKKFDSEKPVPENWAAWRFFYKRSFIDGILFPDLPIDEDIKFFINVSKRKGFCVTLIEDVLYHHTFPRKGSIVTDYYKDFL